MDNNEEISTNQAGQSFWQKARLVLAKIGEVPVSYTHLTLPTICSV